MRKTADPLQAPLVPILTTEPMELLAIDFLSIEKGKGGYDNLLIVTDSFTKYSWAFPTSNKKAKTVAKVLWEKVLVHYGFPRRLHSDQGRDFESRLFNDLCNVAGIEKTRSSTYHPQGNGQTERFNQILLGMLGTLSGDKKTDWPSYVAPLVYAYNSTKHGSTGYSPYYLMFGRQPRLPADVALGLDKPEKEPKPYAAYVDNLRALLAHAYDSASEAMHKRAEYNKKSYDRYAKENSLEAGDRVLVRNLSTRGKHKLQDRWEATPYIISRKVRELPVYAVKPEGGGKERVLHRNLLLPCRLPERQNVMKRRRRTQSTERRRDKQDSAEQLLTM